VGTTETSSITEGQFGYMDVRYLERIKLIVLVLVLMESCLELRI